MPLSRPLLVLLAALLPCAALADEATDPDTIKYVCAAATANAASFEGWHLVPPDEVAACEGWYPDATPELREVAVCQAAAQDDKAWEDCKPDSGPARLAVLPWRPTDRAELDRQISENAGLLAALADSSELDGIFGSSGLDSDLTSGIGGLIGTSGTEYGSGGLGSRGSGLGGGGTAEGLGGLGTRGRGTGASGYGSGGGYFGSNPTTASMDLGNLAVTGTVDKEAAAEVVRRHMNQLRYCYMRTLNKDPNVAGKVVIEVTIAPTGEVTNAEITSTTMHNTEVEDCLVGRFMRFQFVETEEGGTLEVPMIFQKGSDVDT